MRQGAARMLWRPLDASRPDGSFCIFFLLDNNTCTMRQGTWKASDRHGQQGCGRLVWLIEGPCWLVLQAIPHAPPST